MLESLALKHAETVDLLRRIAGCRLDRAARPRRRRRNDLLCQWTADASDLPVLAGPEEATLLGNLLTQAMALGEVGSIDEARAIVRTSFAPTTYEPRYDAAWAERRDRFAAWDRVPPSGCVRERHARRPARNPRSGEPVGERRDGGLLLLDALVYRSNLLGADRALANHRRRKHSAKESAVDHTGRETRVLWVKGSGTDLATIVADRLRRLAPRRVAAAS